MFDGVSKTIDETYARLEVVYRKTVRERSDLVIAMKNLELMAQELKEG